MSTLAVTPAVSSKTLGSSPAVNEQAAAKTLGQLIGDVQSGSIAAARTDLASLTQQLGTSAQSEATSPLGKLLTELGGDLSSGDLSGAQASVGSFLSTLSSEAAAKPAVSGHHGHHHGGASTASESTDTQTVSSGTGASAAAA